MQAFVTALDTYSDCLVASAEKLSADSGDSPETIADRAHAACGIEYGKAVSLSIVYTASTVPGEGALKASEYATQHMSRYRAEVRAGLLKSIAAWRAKGGVDGPAEKKAIFVFVKIPDPIMPVDRGGKYEEPLDESLRKAGFGEVTGGGSQLGAPDKAGTRQIEWVGMDVDLTDLTNGLPFLKSELKRLGAPAGTTIEYEVDGKRVAEGI